MAGACAFCGAASDIVATDLLDEKWSRRFGGTPVVALDHGWYTTSRGERRELEHLDPTKFFEPRPRAVCDFCVHGWVEDVRWRAEPTLLALAQGTASDVSATEAAAVVRWARLTAMLAELIEGMPRAASAGQRDAVRRAGEPHPAVDCWVFAMRQRLPARVHLSQVPVPAPDHEGLVQVVSVDLAHLCVLVLLPSSAAAAEAVTRSGVRDELGTPVSTSPHPTHPLDLGRMRHPHRVALRLVCGASGVAAC